MRAICSLSMDDACTARVDRWEEAVGLVVASAAAAAFATNVDDNADDDDEGDLGVEDWVTVRCGDGGWRERVADAFGAKDADADDNDRVAEMGGGAEGTREGDVGADDREFGVGSARTQSKVSETN